MLVKKLGSLGGAVTARRYRGLRLEDAWGTMGETARIVRTGGQMLGRTTAHTVKYHTGCTGGTMRVMPTNGKQFVCVDKA